MMISQILCFVVVFVCMFVNGLPGKLKVGLSWDNDVSYPFKFYTRQDWNAVPPTQVVSLHKPVPYVVIHHTYIPGACNTTEKCKADMRSMQRYHNSQGWGDIGYNFCLGSQGDVYEGRGWKTKGIHAGKANGVSVGICLIGDWRTELPPAETLEATAQLIEAGVRLGYISPDYKLVGHRQAMATECPGGALYSEIQKWPHYATELEI